MGRQDISKKIALAGVGASISLVFVTLSFFFRGFSITFNILAAVGLMLPLSQKYYREAILAFVAAGGIAAIYATIYVLPFVMVTGSYTIAAIIFYEKKVKKIITYPIIAIYASFVFFVFYRLLSFIFFPSLGFINDINMPAAGLYALLNFVFIMLFVLFDFGVVYLYKNLTPVINKITK